LVANLANADMVGHTGNLRATQLALGIVDQNLKRIAAAVIKRDGTLIITSDHGNAEEKVNWESGRIVKEHTANPVPCVLVGESFKLIPPRGDNFELHKLAVSGVLSDVAATALSVIGLKRPEAMTSHSLI